MSSPAPSDAAGKLHLGYWKIRGLAEPIRTLLRYLGVAFTDDLFEQGDAPSFSRESWLRVKPTLDLDYANLPYLIDETGGGAAPVRLTQSAAILRYIARAHGGAAPAGAARGAGLYDGAPARLAAVDEALEQAIDLRNQYTRVGYGGAPFEAFCDSVLPGFLAAFDRALARSAAAAAGAGAGSGHGGWLAPGAGPSIADFVLGEVLDGVTTMVAELGAAAGRETDALKPYPAVAAYKQRFDALVAPAREGAMTRPFNNKVAVWK